MHQNWSPVVYRHYKHKRDPLRFLYHEDGRPLSDPSPEYASIQNWDQIEEFESIENIPEDIRRWVVLDGYRIYSQARGPD